MLKTKRKCAVFTIVKNESVYLPIWLRYYKKYFNDKDIYVLDHESTDGSTENLSVNCKLVTNDLFQDNEWLLSVTKEFQRKLLRDYRQVLFAIYNQSCFYAYPHRFRNPFCANELNINLYLLCLCDSLLDAIQLSIQ